LSAISLDLLKKAKGNNPTWVYPSPKGLDQAVTVGSHGKNLVKNETGIDDFRPHDLRRTFATNLAKLGIKGDLIDRLLNHVNGGVRKIYDRYDYVEEKTEAMNKWSDHLSELLGLKLSS